MKTAPALQNRCELMENNFVAKKMLFSKSDESEHSDNFFLLFWYPMQNYFNCQLTRESIEKSHHFSQCKSSQRNGLKPGNICLHLSCFNFVFLRQIRLQPRDDIDE